MRIASAVLLLGCMGCKQGAGDDYPINPGGDDQGMFMPMVDAPVADQVLGDGAMLNGRVCLVEDLRTPTTLCADSGAQDIIVQLGSSTTMTAADGTFSIAFPGGTNLAWRVGATDLVTSVIPLSTSHVLPVITAEFYGELTLTNGVIINAGQGSLVVYVREGGVAALGATVSVSPTPTFPQRRDTTNRLVWPEGDTGPLGISWTAGIEAGLRDVRVTSPTGAINDLALPVVDGAITYTTVTF